MTTPPGDDERFEHIPWEQIAPSGNRRNLILYGVAAAILIAGLTAALVRGGGAPTELVSTPTTATAETVSTSIEEAATTTGPTIAPSTTTQNTSTGGSQVWSEADLMAISAETLAAEAAAVAEWVASDFFTVDGGTQIADDLNRVLPEGSALPAALPGARSFVEWARAVSVHETAPGLYEVLVVVRRLGAADGESYRRVAPIGVIISLSWTEPGWSVIDLPVLADAPLLVQAPAWSQTDVPGEIAAAADTIGGEVLAGIQVDGNWRLVVEIDDPTGVSWPMVIWLDPAGNRIPVPAQPVQP